MVNLVDSTAKNPRQGEVLATGFDALTPEILAEASSLGNSSTRLYVDDVIRFDPKTFEYGVVLDKAGKPVLKKDGEVLKNFFMIGEVTRNKQSRVIKFNLNNDFFKPCEDTILGELATIVGMTMAGGDGGRMEALKVFLTANPEASFSVKEFGQNPQFGKDGVRRLFDVPSFTVSTK